MEQFTEIKKNCVTLHLVGHTLEYVLAYHVDITSCLKITAAGYKNKIQTEQKTDLVQNHAVTLSNLQILLRETNYFSFTDCE